MASGSPTRQARRNGTCSKSHFWMALCAPWYLVVAFLGGQTLRPPAHFLFSASRQGGGAAVEDRPAVSEGFSRRLIEGGVAYEPHWSPDGTRFVFSDVGQTRKLMLAHASGGRAILLDELGPSGTLPGPSWSPDG